MNIRILTSTIATLSAALLIALTPACGGDDEGGSGSGDDGGSTSGSSSSSQCDTGHDCIGGSCQCTTSGKESQSCCDPDDCGADDPNNCVDVCEVCS